MNNNKRNTIEDAMRAEMINPNPIPVQNYQQFNYGYPYQQQSLPYNKPQNMIPSNQYVQQSRFQQYPIHPQFQYAQQIQQPQQLLTLQQQQQQQQQLKSQQQQQLYQIQSQSQQSQQSQQQQQQYLPPLTESELPQESRWENDLKVYSYLYRKLGIQIPNLASARFCNSREVFTEQTLLSVKQYVDRAFTKCQSDEERNLMEQYLKATIAEAKRKNEYSSRDWAKFPLPTLPRENQIRTQTLFSSNLSLKPSTNAVISQLNNSSSSKFGAPSSAPSVGAGQTSTSMQNLMSLYDMFKQKQVDSINLNHIKKKPMECSMDFMMLQARKIQPNLTTQFKQQQKQMKKKFDEEDKYFTDAKIIGTCEDLEKPYFRLTGLPDPNMIRPEHILKKSLTHILKKWKNFEKDYNFIIEQFRSLRQDLLVQHIQNHFTVQVYEENARICLECGDFARYESCWTMLCELYEMISISEGRDVNQIGNKVEFDSYRIVYLTMLNKQDQIVKILHQINDDNKIKFALDIRESYKSGNYVKLFKDYREAPETMSSVIDHFLVRIRIKALRLIVKTHLSNVDLQYLADLLSFQDLEQFRQFLAYFDLVRFDETLKYLHVKQSVNAFDNINFEKLNE